MIFLAEMFVGRCCIQRDSYGPDTGVAKEQYFKALKYILSAAVGDKGRVDF